MGRRNKNEIDFKIEETNSDGVELFVSNPFETFDGECDFCVNFISNPPICEGGHCDKHGFNCGYGFTCNDFEQRI